MAKMIAPYPTLGEASKRAAGSILHAEALQWGADQEARTLPAALRLDLSGDRDQLDPPGQDAWRR